MPPWDVAPVLPADLPSTRCTSGVDSLKIHVDAWLTPTNENTRRAIARGAAMFQAFAGTPSLYEAIWLLISDGGAGERVAPGPGYAEAVLTAYRKHLEQAKPKRQVNRDGESGYSANTIRNSILVIGGLLGSLRQVGLISWHPATDVPPASAYRDTTGCGVDGFRRLLAAARAVATPFRERNQALLLLLWRGLRVGELVDIDLEHVDLGATPPRISIFGKWRQSREFIEIAPNQMSALAAWIAVRGREPGPLFWRLDNGRPDQAEEAPRQRRERRTSGGKRLTTVGAWKILQQLGRAQGMSPGVCHPHAIRHTVITELLERAGGNIRRVQAFARLSRAEIVEIYDDRRHHHGLAGASLLDDVADAGDPSRDVAEFSLPPEPDPTHEI
jgi:integrase/recombinase XerC